MANLVDNNEVYSLGPGEFRFKETCLFYTLFMDHHGPAAGLKDNRFLWMSYADAFLMALVSLQDLVDPKPELYKSDTFRFLKVMRNITVHQAAVAASSPYSMVNKDVAVQGGSYNPNRPDHDDPILVAHRIETALQNYEFSLKARPDGIDRKTGLPKSMWDRERRTVTAARRWNKQLAASPVPRIRLSIVFLEGVKFVGEECGFVLPDLPLPFDPQDSPARESGT